MKTNKKCVMLLVLFFSGIYLFAASSNRVLWGTNLGPETLDPAQAWDNISVFFTYNIFDTLVKSNINTQEIEPSLALSWQSKNNGKVWVFKLREGVKFHDGTDFDAQAVVFSFQRQMDKSFEYRYYHFPLFEQMFSNIKKVRAIDRNTVEFSLFKPFSPFLAILTTNGASIVSPSAIKKYKEKFNENPVGTGPFKLNLWEKGKRIVLVQNSEYWRGKSDFEEFVTLINPRLETLHDLFGKQQIDILNSFSISRAVTLKKLKWVTFLRVPTYSVSYIVFNFDNEYLKKINIRKAIRYLWDKRIIKYVFQDFVDPLELILPAGLTQLKRMSGKRSYSPEKALQLLREEKISGKINLEFLLLKEMGLDRRMISLFSKNLNKAGIKIKIKSAPNKEYMEKIKNGEFDLTVSAWTADYPDPHNILSCLFYPQLKEEGFANLSFYKNSQLPELIEKSTRENNLKEREKIYNSVVRMIDEKVLCIPVYQNTSVVIYNNRKVSKIAVTPTGNISLFDIKKK